MPATAISRAVTGSEGAAGAIRVTKDDLLLERVFRWERERARVTYLVQPMGGGRVIELTWADAVGEARRMAAHLKGRGFPPGSRIAIIAKNTAHFFLADLAIWMAGHVSVALYPTVTADTVRYVLTHSDARLVFVGKLDVWSAMKPGVPAGLPRIALPLSADMEAEPWEHAIAGVEPLSGEPVRDAEDTATIMYTSGSTGRPKGVEHAFRALSIPAMGASQLIQLSPYERLISYLPLAHTFERALVEAGSMYFGFTVYFADSLETFMDDMRRARPTIFHSVPRLWMKFQAGVQAKVPPKRLALLLRVPVVAGLVKRKILRGLVLDSVHYALTGSAPLPAEVIAWYRALGLELLEGYSMTENFAYSHIARPGGVRPGYVGPPLPGVGAKLGPDGEVLVKSPAMMKGYYRDPETTAASFTADGYLRTGDRGEIASDGQLRITGRVKDLFKTSKGKYVAPAPIENLLNASDLVEQSCVMGASLAQPLAVVLLNADARRAATSGRTDLEARLAALRNEVNAHLVDHERLFTLVVARDEWTVADGLLTPTMKVKRDAIERRYESLARRAANERTPVCWE